jgi:hypothetical protein
VINYLIILILVITLGGCTPSARLSEKNFAMPSTPAAREPILTSEEIEDRIAFLNTLLSNADISSDDREIISILKTKYEAFKSTLTGSFTAQEEREAVKEIIAGLEASTQSFISRKKNPLEECRMVVRSLAESRKEIIDLYKSGDTKGVIARCTDLQTRFGVEAFTLELTAAFAFSLAEEGKTGEAISVAEGAVRRIKEDEKLFRIEDSLDKWRTEAAIIRSPGEGMAEKKRLAEVLARTESLMKTGDFEEAKDYLAKSRNDFTEQTSLYEIDRGIGELDERKERFLEERIAAVSRRSEAMAEARDLIAREKPEEALAKLKALEVKDAQPDPETKALTREAIEELIAKERNRAARLFLQARNTDDPATKEQLLLLAYGTLRTLQERYPESPSIKKVTENMQAVEKELSNLKKAPSTRPGRQNPPGSQ